MITPQSEPDGSAPASDSGELVAVALAGSVWLGAARADLVFDSRWTLLVIAVLALVAFRRPLLLTVPAFLLSSHLAARADLAYVPMEPGPIEAVAAVLSDPEPILGGWRLELRLPDGDRVQARAYGRAGVNATKTVVGETVAVTGTVKPVIDQPWLRSRHITGIVAVDGLEPRSGPGIHHRVPEFIRRRISAGASGMSERQRALYLGLVIGDDRLQPLGQQLRFKAAGLTHLLAVSGQNVAFALAVARPLLQLFGYRGRFIGVIGVLILFAILTRLEPSVLRATATAGTAAWATMSGRERTGLTVLSVAVVLLLCVDPFLVDAVGFQLSVAASAGILALGPVLERRLPGPQWVRSALAVTLGAQLGVSPLLTAYFGPMSLASVPANLLAGWAAAIIMTIGLSVGVLAGLLPSPAGDLLQLPAQVLLWWVEWVAALSAWLPAPRLGMASLSLAGAAFALIKFCDGWRARVVPVAVLLFVAAAAIPRAPSVATNCGAGVWWYPGEQGALSALVVSGDAGAWSLEDCLSAGVRSVDVLVAERGGASSARLVTAADEIFDIGSIVAPPQHRVVGARRQLEERRIRTASGVLLIAPSTDRHRLDVTLEY